MFFTKHAWLWSSNDSYSQFPRLPLGTPGTTTAFVCTKYEGKKNGLQFKSLAAYVSEPKKGQDFEPQCPKLAQVPSAFPQQH